MFEKISNNVFFFFQFFADKNLDAAKIKVAYYATIDGPRPPKNQNENATASQLRFLADITRKTPGFSTLIRAITGVDAENDDDYSDPESQTMLSFYKTDVTFLLGLATGAVPLNHERLPDNADTILKPRSRQMNYALEKFAEELGIRPEVFTFATYTNKAAMARRALAEDLVKQKAEKKDVVAIFEETLSKIQPTRKKTFPGGARAEPKDDGRASEIETPAKRPRNK